MLKELGQNIWLSEGAAVEVFGFHYPTRMAVIRLSNGDLFVWSPIAFTDDLRFAIDTLGSVAHIVAPNSLHHLSILDWQSAYPNALVYAAPKLSEKRKDISFDQELGNAANSGWVGEIDQVVFEGCLITTEVVFFHRKSGTVLFTDILQQFPNDWFSGWRRLIAKFDKMLSQKPSVPRKFRLAFTNRQAARASLDRITQWPAKVILMAHGEPVKNDVDGFLDRAFSWLKT